MNPPKQPLKQNSDPDPESHQKAPQLPASSNPSGRLGGAMIVGFWIVLLGLGYLWASRHLEFMNNPNPSPESRSHEGRYRVELAINRYGHYVTAGTINGVPVTFLLDTGATSVSISASLGERLGLDRGYPVQLSTANGTVTGYSVSLGSVAIGNLTRSNVRAHINPGLPDDEVLLGMSYLRHFQLTQRRDTLTLEEYQ